MRARALKSRLEMGALAVNIRALAIKFRLNMRVLAPKSWLNALAGVPGTSLGHLPLLLERDPRVPPLARLSGPATPHATLDLTLEIAHKKQRPPKTLQWAHA